MHERISPYSIDGSLSRLKERVKEINEKEKPDATIILAHETPEPVAAAMYPAEVLLVAGGHVHRGISDVADNGIPYSGKVIDAFSVFGADGMGDADLIHPAGEAQEKDAVSFIIDTVRDNPGEVELVVLGPATNIALAIRQAPEVMKQVKMIWSMGSAGLGPGNASPVAEFNVCHDPDAYKIMLDFGVPVTVIGLDVCAGGRHVDVGAV